MTFRFRLMLALLVALGVVSSAATAASAPVRQVPGEPMRSAKAETVAQFRAAEVAPVRLSLGELDLARIAEVQKRNTGEHIPVQIGVHRRASEAEVALPSPTWRPVEGGAVTRFEIASPDALGLRIGLKLQNIPVGIEIRVAGSLAPDVVHFAPGSAVAWQHRTARTYWTPATDGDRQLVEVFVPAGADRAALKIELDTVSHLLTNSRERFSLAKAIGDSGACNVDVVCRINELGQDYVDTKNAVARMVFTPPQGTYTCTGTLLADTLAGSQIPYFYTADHCISSSTVAATLNTYWGFEATVCGGSTPAANTLRSQGADYLYSERHSPNNNVYGTDAALLRLREPPPAGAYFNGWNANPMTNGSVLAVHHPQGDLKKSSLGQRLGQDEYQNEVGWTSGTTEGGSSGSGLFTATGAGGSYELRGGLYGGFASCANSGSLSNTNNRDYYSRLDKVYDDIDQYLAPTTNAVGPTRDYTGAWYVPSESGWGFTAFQYDNEDQVLFILFFIYDANGVAKWYELGGGWSATDVRTGDVVESRANQPWSTSFNPALRTFTSVGNASLSFTSATTASLTITVNGVTRTVGVQKL